MFLDLGKEGDRELSPPVRWLKGLPEAWTVGVCADEEAGRGEGIRKECGELK